MICDLETGLCGAGGEAEMQFIDLSVPEIKIDLYYVTDPICSHCWALEPVMRKFVAQYGGYFNMHTLMGGMLEKWNGLSDVSNGISGPGDVADHWREVGDYSRMPIDGTVWNHDPIESSFIPSRVFKVIHEQSPELADNFLRRAREELFAFNYNIAKDEKLVELVNSIGLVGEDIVKKSKLPQAETSLHEDFKFVGQLGVRGFPTIVFLNQARKGVKVVGARSLEHYVSALHQVLPDETLIPNEQLPNLQALLQEEKNYSPEKLKNFMELKKRTLRGLLMNN